MQNEESKGYSIIQGSNIMAIASAIALIVSHPDFSDPNNVNILLTAGFIIITSIVSFYSRWKKGDVKLSGFKK